MRLFALLLAIAIALSACATRSGDMSDGDAASLAHAIRHIGAAP